jgi:hypothetical protein
MRTVAIVGSLVVTVRIAASGTAGLGFRLRISVSIAGGVESTGGGLSQPVIAVVTARAVTRTDHARVFIITTPRCIHHRTKVRDRDTESVYPTAAASIAKPPSACASLVDAQINQSHEYSLPAFSQ